MRRGGIYTLEEEPKKNIPIKSLYEISEKFKPQTSPISPEEQKMSDQIKELLIPVSTEMDKRQSKKVYNISKKYYNKLNKLSQNYFSKIKDEKNENKKESLKNKFEKATLENIDLLQKNILSDKKEKDVLDIIIQAYDDKINSLVLDKEHKIVNEKDAKKQIQIEEYYNKKINKLRDIKVFYKGLPLKKKEFNKDIARKIAIEEQDQSILLDLCDEMFKQTDFEQDYIKMKSRKDKDPQLIEYEAINLCKNSALAALGEKSPLSPKYVRSE